MTTVTPDMVTRFPELKGRVGETIDAEEVHRLQEANPEEKPKGEGVPPAKPATPKPAAKPAAKPVKRS